MIQPTLQSQQYAKKHAASEGCSVVRPTPYVKRAYFVALRARLSILAWRFWAFSNLRCFNWMALRRESPIFGMVMSLVCGLKRAAYPKALALQSRSCRVKAHPGAALVAFGRGVRDSHLSAGL
jgi:hypothetical protein